MKTEPALPDELELEAGVDPPLSDQERQELEELGALLRTARDFDLAPAAQARGRAELEALLQGQHRAPRRTRAWLWATLPLAAGVLFAWLDPLGLRGVPLPAAPPELAAAQSALLGAELIGAPISREDLDRATRAYRQELLARLEQGP